MDEKQKSVLLTEEGYEAAEDVLEVWGMGYGSFPFMVAMGVAVTTHGMGTRVYTLWYCQTPFTTKQMSRLDTWFVSSL